MTADARVGCLFWMLALAACEGGSDKDSETDVVVDSEVADSDAVDTDASVDSDTVSVDSDDGAEDSDVGDTEVADTDPVDTDMADTDASPGDTDVADTGELETGLADSDDSGNDTASGDTGVDESGMTDTSLPFLGFVPGEYSIDAATRWNIQPGGATTSNVMLLYLRVDVAPTGVVTGSIVNVWTVNEINVNATCSHDLVGSLAYAPTVHGVTVQFTVDSIADAVCDTPPDSIYQYAWTDAMRANFEWFGFVPVDDIQPSWSYSSGTNIASFVSQQIVLGQDIQFFAITMGTGDYLNPDPAVAPYAFFGPVEAR